MIKLIKFFLLLFDNYQSRKLTSFIKKKLTDKFDENIFFDIGAHKGETTNNFLKNFNFKEFHLFEPQKDIFKILERNLSKKKSNIKIHLNNFALGEKTSEIDLNSAIETSSSTFNEINENSDYFLRKKKLFGQSNKTSFFIKKKVSMMSTKEYIKKYKIKKIDILKLDTEGYEYYILNSFDEFLKNVKVIYFEHHYDLMIKKGYYFSDVSKILKKFNFKQVYKHKMFFRKSFEYIYLNES